MSFSESLRRKYAALPPVLRQVLHLSLVALLAAIVGAALFKSAKTNRVYLRELIETKTIERTAFEFTARLRASQSSNDISSAEWQRIEEGLRKCIVNQATIYITSDDTYLSQRANSETPTILASRFLQACGV